MFWTEYSQGYNLKQIGVIYELNIYKNNEISQ